MNSSIFSSDLPRRYLATPRRTRGWHAGLAGGFVGLLVAGSLLLRTLSPPPEASDARYIDHLDAEIEVLFAGSSHVTYGFDPRLSPWPAINLATGGLNYELLDLILRRRLDAASGLRLVVLETGIIPLRSDSIHRYAGDYAHIYTFGLPLREFPRGPIWRLRQAARESWLLAPIYFSERLTPAGQLWFRRSAPGATPEPTGDLPRGGHLAMTGVISEANDGPVILGYHRADLARDHTAANTAALFRLVQALHARGIYTLFVHPPHHRSYVEGMPAEWREQVDEFRRRLEDTLDPALGRTLDWESHPAFTDDHFADAHHLNTRGATLLMQMLQPELAQHLPPAP